MNIPEGDHILVDGCAWLETNGVSIRIHTADDGSVYVAAYRVGEEADETLGEFQVDPS